MKLNHVLLIHSAALFLAVQSGANASVVYFNDFESAIGSELTLTSGSGVLGLDADSSPASKFLGLDDSLVNGGLGNNEVTLSLTGLPTHSAITVSFDFYKTGSMDGGFNCCGPDYFVFKLDSFTRTTTFGGPTQAFPNFIETGGTPADNAADTGGILGPTPGIAFFPLTFYNIPHAGSSVAMRFSMNGLQGVFDEGWGLDNVRVDVNAVPEPPTYVLLAFGAVIFGTRIRRRHAPMTT